jgi:tRNA nucleotidyltransferase (CCA-adding enzyme)
MVEARWEHYRHGADIGVRGIGPDREAAFAQAALALTAAVADPASVKPKHAVTIACEAPDDELLLVDWLNGLIYEMAVRGMMFSRFEVRLDGRNLEATAWGEPVEVARHRPAVEAKGATYTDLRVGQDADGGWVAQCVIDV